MHGLGLAFVPGTGAILTEKQKLDLDRPVHTFFLLIESTFIHSNDRVYESRVIRCHQERCEVDEDPRTCQEGVRYVSRDGDVEDTARLRDAWEQKVGDKVYSGIRDGFRGEKFLDTAIAFRENTSKRELIDIIQTLLNVFVAQGFAVGATVSETSDGFMVKLLGPANLWAIEDVTRANSSPLPLYDVFAIEACLRQVGIAPVRCDVSSSMDKFCVEEKWILP